MQGSFPEVWAELMAAESVVLTTHINPDGDALGSMLALYLALQNQGKKVRMWLDGDLPEMYAFLPARIDISHPPLTVSSADLMVVLDAGDAERTGISFSKFQGKVMNIDHHLSNSGFADVILVDETVAATGILVLRLLEIAEVLITPAIATCLFTAVATDCGFFRYANTDEATFEAAARLVRYGAEPHKISEAIQKMPLTKIVALSRVLASLELFGQGKVAAIMVPDDIPATAVEDTEGFIDYPRNIAGVEVAILFKPAGGPGQVKLSMRSRNLNVSVLAQSFGGGGHARAAGCTLDGTMDEVKNRAIPQVIRAIREAGL
jgi:bifunctional oligoribonuclease and PAP phosphatase NrnA